MKTQTPASLPQATPAPVDAAGILDNFGGSATWATDFRAQLGPTGVVNVLRGADPSTVQLAATAPFRSLSPEMVATTKNALWDQLAPVADRQRIWVALYDAGLVPDAPADASSKNRRRTCAQQKASWKSPRRPSAA